MARAKTQELQKEISNAAEPLQRGLAKDGAGSMCRTITAQAGINKGTVVASMVISSAFPTISREAVLKGCAERAPGLHALTCQWLATPVQLLPMLL